MKQLLFKRKFRFWLYFVACFFPVASDLLRTYIFAELFGAIADGNRDYFLIAVIMAGFYVIIAFLIYISSRLLRISFMRDTILDVRIAAFEKIMNTSYRRFSSKSKDVYVSNLINDVTNFENNFFINLLNIIYRAGMYLASLAIIISIDYKLGLALVLFSVIIFFISRTFEKKTVALQKKVSSENENFTINIANTFNGLEILKLNNIEEKFKVKSFDAINKVETGKFRFRFFSEGQRTLTRALAGASTLFTLVYLLFQLRNGMTYADMMLLVMLAGNVVFALPDIFPRVNVVKSSMEIYNKITVLEEEPQVKKKEKVFAFSDKIEVSDLTFGYDTKEIFRNASFTIAKGKKYLIKGPSGIGKSTLIKLLSMTYDDYSGTIAADGVDLKTISDKSFTNKVAYIYQEVFLFEDTIKNNITLFKKLDQKTINEAVSQSGLTEFMKNKEKGLDELVSENGKNLSGGERQRLSIARAIAKKAEILFIDEGTSAVNEDLGKEIEQTFLNLDNTVVSISHRYYPGVTDHYDFVLEIKDGKVNTYTGKEYFAEETRYA